MAKKEVKTDLWVAAQLTECGIEHDAQGSNVKEINDALKTASKRGTRKAGYPEYVAVVNDYVVVIEDKAALDKHKKLTPDGVIDTDQKAVTNYAVNGALFYAKHIAQNSSFKKVFAIGVSGDEKHHKITPLYVDDREGYKELPDVESFVSFSQRNIHEYYTRYVLEEPTDVEKTTADILKDAAELHEYLRTYGSLKDQDKPLVVAGILLALDEIETRSFHIEDLIGDQTPKSRDGDKIMAAIETRLTRSNVGPEAKKDKLLSEFSIIKTSFRLNEINKELGKTPLKFYAEFLYERVFRSIKYQQTSEDFIGRFYGEFMSYSGGDGQSLGIILTPRHITDLMCEIVNVRQEDKVLDPTCGTGGFLISAMHRMLSLSDTDTQKTEIKTAHLHGFELQSNMFAIACTNMILRGDGNSNLECCDFLAKNPAQVQLKQATVGLMNPPYSQGTKADPEQYELSFIEHLLDSLTVGARAAVIVPQSSMTGKSKAEQAFKTSIMEHHTLEGVITCNTDTFYGVGVNPVIAVFTAHEPHPKDKVCKFIDFRDDGYEVRAHVGLVEGDSAKDKKQHLLDVWFGRTEAPSKFCVESTVQPDDEWLHSFYYFNDEIPTDADFEKAIGDYLTFEFSMVMQMREGMLMRYKNYVAGQLYQMEYKDIPALDEKEWKEFRIGELFEVSRPKARNKDDYDLGDIPFVASGAMNNGVMKYCKTREGERLDAGNCITVSPVDGSSFYQPMDFLGRGGAGSSILMLRNDGLNLLRGEFMARMIQQTCSKYSYGHMGNKDSIKRERVMLPVDDDGKPDYAYMEQYAKNMMLRKHKQFLSFLDRSEENAK